MKKFAFAVLVLLTVELALVKGQCDPTKCVLPTDCVTPDDALVGANLLNTGADNKKSTDAECQMSCTEITTCTTWTFFWTGQTEGHCELYTGTPGGKFDPNAVSGWVTC